jgi:hypothetical protein
MKLLVEFGPSEISTVLEVLKSLESAKGQVSETETVATVAEVPQVLEQSIQVAPVQPPVIQAAPVMQTTGILQAPAITSTQPAYEVTPLMPTVNYPLVSQPGQAPTYTPQPQQPQPQQPQQQAAPVQYAPPQEQTPIVQTLPTTPATYTMEQLAVAGTQLMDAGKREELVGLLASFGVQALTQLPKEQYGNLAIQLRALGAKI